MQVAGLHRASPSAALDKKSVLLGLDRIISSVLGVCQEKNADEVHLGDVIKYN